LFYYYFSYKVATIQTVAGTGALKVACEFLKKAKNTPIYLSNPTWGKAGKIIIIIINI